MLEKPVVTADGGTVAADPVDAASHVPPPVGALSRPTVLDGIVVLELGVRIGAAVCGALLGQLGATVVCVEQREAAIGKWHGRDQLAAGKLSFVPDGTEDELLLAEAAATCDVVVTSSDLGTWQLGESALRAGADAIVCDITAFGASGPLAGLGWSDLQIQAISGVLDSTGREGGPPTPIAIPIIEQVAGIYAAASIVAALRVRRRDGTGQAIEIALYDVAFSLMTSFLPVLLSGVANAGVSRVGNRQTLVAPWNVYRAVDGWLLLCAGSDEQWRRVCEVIGQPALGTAEQFARAQHRLARVGEVDALVGGWVGSNTVADCVARLGAAVIPCGPVIRIDGFPREDNLIHRLMVCSVADPSTQEMLFIPASPLRMSCSPGQAPQRLSQPGGDHEAVATLVQKALLGQKRTGAPPTAASDPPTNAGALAGLRVIEIGHYTTAPLAARHLANLGAEVIKVEAPGGEAVRNWPPARGGQGLFFTFQNTDKRSIVLDMSSDHGRATLTKLIATADVLIENLKPGALAKRGFSPDTIHAINPRIVTCGVSGFGGDSLYAGRPAFDAVIQAMSGLMDVVNAKDMPLKTGPSSADVMGAAMALTAILAALEYRDRTGVGQHLDLSMQDIGAWATQARWNQRINPAQTGVIIRCGVGYVVAAASAAVPEGLAAEALSLTRAQVVEQLEVLGIAAAPILDIGEVVRAEQTRARRLWFDVERDGVAFPLLASPLRLQRTPARVVKPGPVLGRDTEAVLAELAAVGGRAAPPAGAAQEGEIA